jgi:outer membrane protein
VVDFSRKAGMTETGLSTLLSSAPRFLLIAMLAGCLAPAAQAQSRVAIVHFERLLSESPLAKAADKKLFAEFKQRETEIQDQASRLRKLTDKFDADAPKLGERERIVRAREVRELEAALVTRQNQFREDLSERKTQERSAIANKAYAIIQDITEKQNLDLVLLDAWWYNPRVDITDKVLARLDK